MKICRNRNQLSIKNVNNNVNNSCLYMQVAATSVSPLDSYIQVVVTSGLNGQSPPRFSITIWLHQQREQRQDK